MSMHRKHRVKAGKKSKGHKDGHEGCDVDQPEVSGLAGSADPHQSDCTKLLDDIPSFEWDDSDAQWERLEEEDWMGNVSVKYFNPVTRKLRVSPPGEHNVCSYIHTTFDNQEIEVFAPLKCVESLGKAVVKTGCVEKWSDVEELWSYGLTFREVQHELLKGILQAKMEENACLQFRLVDASDEITRLREEVLEATRLREVAEDTTRLLQEHLDANALALQNKDADIVILKEHVRILEKKVEKNAHLQEKLDMISCFLSGAPQKSPTSVASLRSQPAVREEQERLQYIELKRSHASFTITRAVRARGEQIKNLENSTLDAHVKRIPSTLQPYSASEAPTVPLQPQRDAPQSFAIDCTHNKALSGVYTLEDPDVYRHADGVFVLSMCSGRWTIKDKGRVLCKAVDAAPHPDFVQNWLYLTRQNGTFRPAFPMTVKERKEEPPQQTPTAADATKPYVEQAADWVCTEERDGFFVNQYYLYYNKVTKERTNDVPAILRK